MAVLQEYKCPCCGGAIGFDSTLQKLKCPYCDTEFDPAALASYDAQLSQVQPDEMSWEMPSGTPDQETAGMNVYVCNSCGGEIVTDETTAATKCPYCDNPVVMTGKLAGDLKPDYIIPFKLNKEMAKQALEKHMSGKRFLPKVFKDQNHIDEIKGIYVPFWLFDADVNAEICYKATRVRVWSDKKYDYTQTSFYSVLRGGSVGFEHIPIDGSEKMADDLMESLEPFNFADAVDFKTAYLAGYLADRYDVTAEKSVQRANQRVKNSTEQMFATTVQGYNSVTPDSSSVRFNNGKAKYALYPVWILNTTWNNKKYTFAMNGETGKFVGDLPMDKGAYYRWLLGLTAGIGAGIFGVLSLLNLF